MTKRQSNVLEVCPVCETLLKNRLVAASHYHRHVATGEMQERGQVGENARLWRVVTPINSLYDAIAEEQDGFGWFRTGIIHYNVGRVGFRAARDTWVYRLYERWRKS